MKTLRWPLPALFTWVTAWLLYLVLRAQGLLPDLLVWLLATLWGFFLMRYGATPMRRLLIAVGFPLSWLAANARWDWPLWLWPALLLLAWLIYPRRAWSDAPLFPTPREALRELPTHAPLGPDARVLDAGSGLGDGLIGLRQAYPHARLHGLEMSWPLRLLSALRCPWAHIRQGDIWLADWSDYDLVYLFQRPESMPRAVQKAGLDLRRGAWLVSLEFEARTLQPDAMIACADGRTLWLYQQPFKPAG